MVINLWNGHVGFPMSGQQRTFTVSLLQSVCNVIRLVSVLAFFFFFMMGESDFCTKPSPTNKTKISNVLKLHESCHCLIFQWKKRKKNGTITQDILVVSWSWSLASCNLFPWHNPCDIYSGFAAFWLCACVPDKGQFGYILGPSSPLGQRRKDRPLKKACHTYDLLYYTAVIKHY